MNNSELLSFGPYLLDTQAKRLTRNGEEMRLGSRQIDLLIVLATRANQTISKEELIAATWGNIIVTTGSVDQALFHVRQNVPMPSGEPLIETHARRGVRFVPPVSRVERNGERDGERRTQPRESDESIDAVLAQHRAFIEGRAGLESLDTTAIVRARGAFELVLQRTPEHASAHVGLANACALQFETTRTDVAPDVASLTLAYTHAREACRLKPRYGEAWATLGFVLERLGKRDDSLAAHRESIELEPDNWRHHLRLSAASWGEERLREARRTLQLLPGLPMAHWLAASVLVARGALDEAALELQEGLADSHAERPGATQFTPIGLHYLYGLLMLAAGDIPLALHQFARELQHEDSGHLYAKEVAANSWYATGAARWRQGRREDALEAWLACVKRVPKHPLARAAMGEAPAATSHSGVDRAIAQAVFLSVDDDRAKCHAAAPAIEKAMSEAPAGNVGWLLPVEPMLAVATCPGPWRRLLTRLRSRAA